METFMNSSVFRMFLQEKLRSNEGSSKVGDPTNSFASINNDKIESKDEFPIRKQKSIKIIGLKIDQRCSSIL